MGLRTSKTSWPSSFISALQDLGWSGFADQGREGVELAIILQELPSNPLSTVGAVSHAATVGSPGACVLSLSFVVTLIFVVVLWAVMLEANQATKLATRHLNAGAGPEEPCLIMPGTAVLTPADISRSCDESADHPMHTQRDGCLKVVTSLPARLVRCDA
eukprot:s4270_g5.t1